VTGDYFIFLDDDDTFAPDFLSLMMPWLVDNRANGNKLLYTNFDVINEFPRSDGGFDIQAQSVDVSANDVATAHVKNFVPNNCVFYPAFLASMIRFDSDIAYEDWDFLLSALSHVAAHHVPISGPRIHKRHDDGWEQRGKKNNERLLECYLKIYAKHPPISDPVASWRREFFKSVGVDIGALVDNRSVSSRALPQGPLLPAKFAGMSDYDALQARTLFAFWLGPYQMSPARTAAVHSIFRDASTPVCFITDTTLHQWELPESPFHEAMQYLSEVHRADYLRCYLMHHFGGGYTDIKPVLNPWPPHFADLLGSDAMALGYPEISANAVAQLQGVIGEQLRTHYAEVIGYCSMVFKRRTAITTEWFEATQHKLSELLPSLREHPAQHPMDQLGVTLPNGTVSSYPLKWTELGGNIFHPVILKHRSHVLKRESIKPQLHNYR
jgi:hypothetical protein